MSVSTLFTGGGRQKLYSANNTGNAVNWLGEMAIKHL